MKKDLFMANELQELEALEVRGGDTPSVQSQLKCSNKSIGCGAGVDQLECSNDVTGCSLPITIQKNCTTIESVCS